MSDNYQGEQAGWEWALDDEERWQAEQLEISESRQPSQQVDDRLLADFDSIFMNEGE